MNADENLLLQTILSDIREIRSDVKELKASQVSIDAFNTLQKTVTDTVITVEGHKNVIQGGNWLVKSAVGALILELVVASFAWFHIVPALPAQASTPAPSPTPQVQRVH